MDTQALGMWQNKTHVHGHGVSEGLLDSFIEQAVQVSGIRSGHAGGSDGVLQDQVPADHEADKLPWNKLRLVGRVTSRKHSKKAYAAFPLRPLLTPISPTYTLY